MFMGLFACGEWQGVSLSAHATSIPVNRLRLSLCLPILLLSMLLPSKLYLRTKTTSISPRYFVDKLPMFFAARGIPSVVTSFSYVEPQEENLSAFVTHLQSYLPLFRKLEQFGHLFISASDALSRKATEIFGVLIKGPLQQPAVWELTRRVVKQHPFLHRTAVKEG